MKLKIKKGLLITGIILVVIFIILIAFISPIAKWAIEKYDTKYLGRELQIGWLYLNPFTGYVYISNFKAYEENSDSLFLTANSLSADFQMLKLFKKTYEINQITLDHPRGYIIQNKKILNFSDLIKRFTPKQKQDTSIHKEPVHFNILNIAVKEGEFHYIEKNIPINYFVKNVNIESPGKWWNKDSINIKFALKSGVGEGDIKGDGAINFDNSHYRIAATVVKFDLSLIDQYLKDLVNYGHLSAYLDADIKGTGNLKDQLDLDANGMVAISQFHFGKVKGDDFASFDKLVLKLDKINPKNFKYYIDSIMLAKPYFKYERYDNLNNIENMFGKNGSKIKEADAKNDAGQFNLIIEIAKYVKVLGKNFLKSYYKINKVAVYDGNVVFNDFSLREKFSIAADPFNLIADSIDKAHHRFQAILTTGVKPYGNIAANLSIDPNNFGNFNLNYKLLKVPVTLFNPYVLTFTSFPLDRGTLEFNGFMNVVDSSIISENHLLIVDPRVAKRVKKKDTKWIPVPLIMSLVRNSGNAIDFNIPIRGNLGDPKFKIWGAIWRVVENIFVKPAISPYLLNVRAVEQSVEKSLSLPFQMRQSILPPRQEKFVERIVDFMKENKEATLSVTPLISTEKEKEQILFFEAKRKYFLIQNKMNGTNLSEEDSTFIDKMSVKDSLFVRYLERLSGKGVLNTIQEKCSVIISSELVNSKFALLLKSRQQVFKNYFGEASNRLRFNTAQNVIPFNGFSYYKIEYKGDFPEKLLSSYNELEDLNSKSPREKYKEKRKARADLKAASKTIKAEK